MTEVTAPPRTSRREARRRHRHDAIVEVAARSFLENGYAGTTMSDIAATLGGSKGTLWSYFPSKEALFAAVLDHLTRSFRDELTLILTPGPGVETTLRRYCTQFLRKVTSRETIALYRFVVRETARFPEVGRIFHERGPLPTQLQLAAYLAGAVGRGELAIADTLAAARQLLALCKAGTHQPLLMGVVDAIPPGQVEADAEGAIAVFLRAYRPDWSITP